MLLKSCYRFSTPFNTTKSASQWTRHSRLYFLPVRGHSWTTDGEVPGKLSRNTRTISYLVRRIVPLSTTIVLESDLATVWSTARFAARNSIPCFSGTVYGRCSHPYIRELQHPRKVFCRNVPGNYCPPDNNSVFATIQSKVFSSKCSYREVHRLSRNFRCTDSEQDILNIIQCTFD